MIEIAIPRTEPLAPTVLILRCCNADGSSSHGFTWPEAGPVAAPDWLPEASCGNGLHGWLWGTGDFGVCNGINENPDARWLVVEVVAADVVDLRGKVKFPRGVVLYSGDRKIAVDMVAARAPAGIAALFGTATAGDCGTATAGDCGTATAGDRGTATAGDRGTATAGTRGTATAGDCGTATAGDCGTATAGDCGTATAGDRGTATAGTRGTATAGDCGTATAGDCGTATAGDCGTATAGYRGTATAGDCGTATAGTRGTATAGTRGTATAGDGGTATAGDCGTIAIQYWCAKREKYRFAVAEVGEDGIKADTAYVLDTSGDRPRFVRKPTS